MRTCRACTHEGEEAQAWWGAAPAKIHALPAVPVEAAAHERAYVHLWKTYFRSVDMPERRNLKLQMRHMPKRHWKHLVEMMGK